MSKVRILLTDPVNGYLDVKDGTVFPLNFSLGDIRDVSKRNGSYSKTVTLVGNKSNNQLLGHLYDVNLSTGAFNINVLQSCLVEQDGIVILDNMYLQLTAVKKVQKTGRHDEEIEYEAQLRDGSGDFFNKIANLELTNLDLGAFNHPYNVTTITNSFSNTYIDGYKYLMPYISNSTAYDIKDFRPAIYVRQYWDKIFDNAGYTYTFDEMDELSIQFNKLIIPYNGAVPKPIEDQTSWVVAERTTLPVTYNLSEGSFPTQLQIYNNEIQDDNGYYNPITGEYTLAFDVTGTDSIQYEISIEYDLSITNNSGQTLTLTGPGQGRDYAVQYVVQKPILNNTIEYGAIFHVPQNTVLNNGATYVLATNFEEIVTINKSSLVTGDVLTNLIGPRPILYGDAITQKWKTAGGVILDMTMNLTVSRISVTIKPSLETFILGSTITLNSFIPKKIKQSDFIKSICQMYNLYVETDPDNETNLILRTRDKFYDDGEIIDWTYKLAKDRDQDIKFLPELSSKKLILSYKPDSDTPNKNYQTIINETYGQVEFVFDNEYVRNTERKELIFSPTPNAYTDFRANVPILIGPAPEVNCRILLDNGVENCFQYTIKESPSVTFTETTYPFISHFNNAENPTFDINFGICDFYFYNPDSLTNNNLYNLHWARTMSQINNGKLLTAFFDLDSIDIRRLKLNDKIRIDNSYWNINKVMDYDANSNDLTRVELISVDDALELGDFPTFNVTLEDPTGDVILPAPGDTYLGGTGDPRNSGNPGTGTAGGGATAGGSTRSRYLNIDRSNGAVNIQGSYNQVSQETRGSVIGDNNLVNAFGYSEITGINNTINSAALVYASNVTIDDNLENVFVFGGDGYNVTTSNTMVVPENLILSGADPSINGVLFSDLAGAATGWPGVLAIDNTSGANDAIMDTTQSIKSGNGGGQLNLDAFGNPDAVLLSVDNGAYAETQLYLDNLVGFELSTYLPGTNSLVSSETLRLDGFNVGMGLNGIGFGVEGMNFQARDNSAGAVTTLDIATSASFISTRNGQIAIGISNAAIIASQSSAVGGDNSAVIGGLSLNAGTGSRTVLAGGDTNGSNSNDTFIGGGSDNIINTLNAQYASIIGGNNNQIQNTSTNSGILASVSSTIVNSQRAAIVAGTSNTLASGSTDSVIIASNGLAPQAFQKMLYNQDNYHDAFHTVTTTNNTITNLYTFTPTDGVYHIEWDITAFETATGDALGAKAFHTFKVIAGVVTSVSTTTLDRKSNFPASVTVTIDTDGTLIRARVTGRTGSTIDWRGHLKIVK